MLQPLKVIQDAVPEELALSVRDEFEQADYDRITQERRGYYGREFLDQIPFVPEQGEVYRSEFHRSNYLEGNAVVRECYYSYIKPLIEETTGKLIEDADLRCYKMIEGGHFRIHRDTYISDTGFIWYLTKNWKWDWGGVLMSINGEGQADATIPQFNQLVIMNHRDGQVPHFVTPVTAWAQEPRYMLVGFLKSQGVN
jgi:Rps23 Pro-64 3,4-dihydroxylase Tpa1-like proline 4-hydroxylase